MNKKMGQKIRDLRKSRNMSQKQLANLCGTSESAVRNYELGNRTPPSDILETICRVLSADYFNFVISYLGEKYDMSLVCLPCEVGNTVYLIGSIKSDRGWEQRVISGKIDRFIIGDLGVPLADICTDDNDWYYACAYPGDFFLTREEAQENIK